MCQMYGPSCHVQCVKCGESYLENLPHKCKPEERDSVPSAPTCEADQGATCHNRDCLVHKEIWDDHKRIEKAAAPTLEEELINSGRELIAYIDSKEIYSPESGLELAFRNKLRGRSFRFENALAAFVRQRRQFSVVPFGPWFTVKISIDGNEFFSKDKFESQVLAEEKIKELRTS